MLVGSRIAEFGVSQAEGPVVGRSLECDQDALRGGGMARARNRMVRGDTVGDVCSRRALHVTTRAVLLDMMRVCVAGNTRSLCAICVRVDVVTGSAPHRATRLAPAPAHCQLLDVTGHFHRRVAILPYEVRHVVRELCAGAVFGEAASRAFDTCLTSEVTLGTDGIALLTPELRGIDHARQSGILHVLASRSVAAFA